MVAWGSRPGSGSLDGDWFAQRFARARALIPDADFDTIIGEDFGGTITSELVDIVGVADADPVDFYNGGVVAVSVGDAVIAPSSARLQLTGSPSHVGILDGKSWYAASLTRLITPDSPGDSRVDLIGLWTDDANRVGLGIWNGSGGSSTNWAGYTLVDGSSNSSLGPLLDGESPVWHLAEMWFNVDTGVLTFALDGVSFSTLLDADDLPSTPARLSMLFGADLADSPFATNFDKVCVIVKSPTVGEAS